MEPIPRPAGNPNPMNPSRLRLRTEAPFGQEMIGPKGSNVAFWLYPKYSSSLSKTIKTTITEPAKATLCKILQDGAHYVGV